MANKYIVCTTINPPTEAIEKFDRIKDWNLIVIGDLKTPKNYKLKKGQYFSPKDQEKIDRKLSDLIGWNCIQRRNYGFIVAHKLGAKVIATVDDDNIPYKDWGKDLLLDRKIHTREINARAIAIDPMAATEHSHLWHRGFPVELLKNKSNVSIKSKLSKSSFQIQADFWNGDPDVDAICRAIHKPKCAFKSKSFPFSTNKFSPFNSQNTFLSRDLFPDYFLFPFIGRMDDIWASYYVQALGHKVVYGKPSVVQKRNPHSLSADFANEVFGYENSLNFVKALKLSSEEALRKFLPKKSVEAFHLYRRHFTT